MIERRASPSEAAAREGPDAGCVGARRVRAFAVRPLAFEARRCQALLAAHLGEALQRLGKRAIENIDLPALGPEVVQPAQLRVAAALFFCRELERAGLPQVTEALAERVARGAIALDLDATTSQRLGRYHAARHERLVAAERTALYERVLDAGVSGAFDALVIALSDIGRTPPALATRRLEVRVAVLGRELAAQLSERAVGVAAFAARDIVAHVLEAHAILDDVSLRRALGARTAWDVVRRWSPGLVGHAIQPDAFVARAAAGRDVLAWLATVALALPTGVISVGREDPVVAAAELLRGTT